MMKEILIKLYFKLHVLNISEGNSGEEEICNI